LADLLDYIRKNPGKLKMSGTATGGAWDLARAGFLLAADLPVNSVLWVPAQGAAPALVELLGGHIDSVCCSLPEAAPQLEARQLRALTVMASERLPDFPKIATAREQGIDWEAIGWRGLVLPKGTPKEIVDLLGEETRKIADSETFKQFMRKYGFAVVIRGPEEFQEFLRVQDAQWGRVIEAAGYASQ
jgi:tripartite-type tricarboxylate transporter receptor subunit TctC